eukprot:3060246-Rhodomonas_salina.2
MRLHPDEAELAKLRITGIDCMGHSHTLSAKGKARLKGISITISISNWPGASTQATNTTTT